MRVTLRRADGHPGRFGDLLERVAERILQEHDLCLLRRDAGERVTELAAKLGVARDARGVVVRPRLEVVGERLVRPCLPPLGRVAAGVDDEPVQPGRELGLAAKLLEPDADLRERLLGRVGGVLRVAEQVPREPLDLRSVPREQGLERPRVAVLRPRHEDGIAQPLVGEAVAAAQLEPDRTGLAAQR